MFSFIWFLIVGLIVGALARFIMPGKDPMGLIATMILGVIGALVGGLVAGLLWRSDGSFSPGGLLLSLLGAVLVLAIWRMIRARTAV